MKRISKLLGAGIGIALLLGILYLLGIRAEFASHLQTTYPDKHFHIGLVGIDPLYDKYYAKVTCKEDETEFSVRRHFSSSDIEDNYGEMLLKNQNQSIAEELFKNTAVEPYISHVSLLSSKLDNRTYDTLYLNLTMDCDTLKTIEEIQKVVQNSNIKVTTLSFLYEKEKHVYEVTFPTAEELTREELQSKIIQIK